MVPLGPNVNGFEDDLKAFVSKNSDGTDRDNLVYSMLREEWEESRYGTN